MNAFYQYRKKKISGKAEKDVKVSADVFLACPVFVAVALGKCFGLPCYGNCVCLDFFPGYSEGKNLSRRLLKAGCVFMGCQCSQPNLSSPGRHLQVLGGNRWK